MKTLLFIFSLFIFGFAQAHPVIYKDGWAVSSSNMPDYSNNYVMYSFSNRLAFGVDHWRMSENQDNNEIGLLKLNHLLWRQNSEESQANIYLHGGVGIEDKEIGEKVTRSAWLGGVEADWETRILYTSFKYYQFQDTYMSQGRIGFSPKEAPFEDLQTWFMLQGMVIGNIQDRLVITPLVRFFYHNVLWEMGSSTRGEWMLNLMVHY
jgi:hypothetical protein